MEQTCRWCNASFSSRNQVFKHVRKSLACAAAAAEEDRRATLVLGEGPPSSAKRQTNVGALVLRYSCETEEAAACCRQVLSAAGATRVDHLGVLGDEQTQAVTSQAGVEQCSVFIMSFCCGSGGAQEILHQTYWALEQLQSGVDGVFAGVIRCVHLLYAMLIPGGHELSVQDLRSKYYSHLSSFYCLGGDAAGGSVNPADLPSCVTVVVITSPMRSDPDLDILETLFSSLALAGLAQCRKLLVCDHLDVEVNFDTSKFKGFKKGRLPKDYLERYRARIALLQHAPWARAMGISVLQLPTWHGFALATKTALAHVSTPLVCVIQHDLAFLRPVDLRPVAAALLRSQAPLARAASSESGGGGAACCKVNFVNFPRCLQQDYRAKLRQRTGLEIGAPLRFSLPLPLQKDADAARGAGAGAGAGAAGGAAAGAAFAGAAAAAGAGAAAAAGAGCGEGEAFLTRLPHFLDGTHVARVDWYRSVFARAGTAPAHALDADARGGADRGCAAGA
eukprot:2473936-Rhodomonas_salina.2